MDFPFDPPDEPDEQPARKTVECGMCRRHVPTEQTWMLSGRILCFGCLASWYDDEDEDG